MITNLVIRISFNLIWFLIITYLEILEWTHKGFSFIYLWMIQRIWLNSINTSLIKHVENVRHICTPRPFANQLRPLGLTWTNSVWLRGVKGRKNNYASASLLIQKSSLRVAMMIMIISQFIAFHINTKKNMKEYKKFRIQLHLT